MLKYKNLRMVVWSLGIILTLRGIIPKTADIIVSVA
jgi:hypothetical protein